jgi:uncharacterized membrane protein YdjX (TVP38/TMEM64 family)
VSQVPRPVLLIAAVAAVVVATKLLLENVLGLNLADLLSRWATDPGAGAAGTIVGLLLIDILLPVPSSLVMLASGALFGVVGGAALSLAGSLAGEWLGFELVRRYGRATAERLVGDVDLDRMQHLMARHGAVAVAVTRALPVVMETLSVVAGLSGMRRSTFLLASLLGTTPIVIVYAWAGANARETGNLVPAMIIVMAVAAAGWVWYRAHRPDSGPTTRPNP